MKKGGINELVWWNGEFAGEFIAALQYILRNWYHRPRITEQVGSDKWSSGSLLMLLICTITQCFAFHFTDEWEGRSSLLLILCLPLVLRVPNKEKLPPDTIVILIAALITELKWEARGTDAHGVSFIWSSLFFSFIIWWYQIRIKPGLRKSVGCWKTMVSEDRKSWSWL